MAKLLNFLIFDVAWTLTVIGAAKGYFFVGPLATLFVFTYMLYQRQIDGFRIVLITLLALFGSALDVILVAAGVLVFETGTLQIYGFPFWMLTLWMAFLTTVESALSWLKHRVALLTILGFIGGPLSYYTAFRLGAVELGQPLFTSLFFVALGWMFVTPLIFEMYYGILSLRNRQEVSHAS